MQHIRLRISINLFSHLKYLSLPQVRVQGVQRKFYPPVFKERLVKAEISENLAAGTFVTKLKVLNRQEDMLTFSITGGSGLGRFRIDDTGELNVSF